MTIQSIETCPRWVRSHRCTQPWTEGRRKIESRLQRWRQEYSSSVHDNVIEPDGEESQAILRRQLTCWVYHWHTAGEDSDGYDVADSIEKGIGFKGNGDLGGNPLFDLCLAIAFVQGHNKAVARFQDDYFQDSKYQAAKVAMVFAKEDTMEWWSEFLDELGGFSGRPAKLDSFDGRVGIRRWLSTVRWNFLRNLLRKRNRRGAKETEWMESLGDGRAQEISMEFKETFAILSADFRTAYEQLDSGDAAILSLFYVEHLTNLQIACLLGINPGTATRRRQRAEECFRDQLCQQLTSRRESLQSMGEALDGIRTDFAGILFEILKEGDGQSPRPEDRSDKSILHHQEAETDE